MEFWTGWFDHWGEPHLERNLQPSEFSQAVKNILAEGGSINLYMFHGGTNFGFMNGGNWGMEDDLEGNKYRPTVSSYGACVCVCVHVHARCACVRACVHACMWSPDVICNHGFSACTCTCTCMYNISTLYTYMTWCTFSVPPHTSPSFDTWRKCKYTCMCMLVYMYST